MASSSKSPSALALEHAIRRGRDNLLGAPPPVHSAPQAPLPSCLANFHVEELEYYSEDPENPASLPSQCWVPLRIVKKHQEPSQTPLPVVIFIHCTGSDKNSQALRQAQYAERGYLTAAIDTRYHGARVDPNLSYQQAIVKSWSEAVALDKITSGGSAGDAGSIINGNLAAKNKIERPFLLDVIWDLQRLLDYLTISRTDDVDPRRIGATGESLGGMVTWYLAAADSRIAAVAPMCGVQNFQYAIEHDLYHARVQSIPDVFTQAAKDLGRKGGQVDREVVRAVWEKVGLLHTPPESGFDAPYSLGLIAPRPCLILTGEIDDKTPLKGVEIAVEHARKAYKQALAAVATAEKNKEEEESDEERLQLFVEKGVGHEFTPAMHREAAKFMDKWLLNR
jgi:dienelactone hydrolase